MPVLTFGTLQGVVRLLVGLIPRIPPPTSQARSNAILRKLVVHFTSRSIGVVNARTQKELETGREEL